MFAQQALLACASLGLIEVIATLSRKRRAEEIHQGQFAAATRELEQDWHGFIEVRLTADTLALAVDVARRFALRGADAVHLASALLLMQRLVDERDTLVLVTADQELKGAARASSLTVLDPAEEQRPA